VIIPRHPELDPGYMNTRVFGRAAADSPRHPGLDPGSMNTRLREPANFVFMGPDFRQDDIA